jgi:hypothetical protein
VTQDALEEASEWRADLLQLEFERLKLPPHGTMQRVERRFVEGVINPIALGRLEPVEASSRPPFPSRAAETNYAR